MCQGGRLCKRADEIIGGVNDACEWKIDGHLNCALLLWLASIGLSDCPERVDGTGQLWLKRRQAANGT